MDVIAPSGVLRAQRRPSRRFREKFFREISALDIPSARGISLAVTEADVAQLPEPAQRYLRFTGALGRPRVWSFRGRWNGRFRMGPDRPWMGCEVWQYNSAVTVSRIFHMRLRFAGIVPMTVRDTYVHGGGRMLARAFDAVSVVDEASEEIAIGELVTYVNDAILLAPTMLLVPEARWTSADPGSFDVALTDQGRTVTARVLVDDDGAVTDFSTTDRYGTDPAHPKQGMVRARWTTPVLGWQAIGGRRLPTAGKAVWHFESGDFAYAELVFDADALELNVAVDAHDARRSGQ